MNAASIISHPLLSLSDACIIGEIDGIFFDKKCKKTEYFTYTSEGRRFAVPKEAILHYSDALVVMSTLEVSSINDLDVTSLIPCPLGAAVYTPTGELKGRVEEVELDDKLRITRFKVGGETKLRDDFSAVGGILILDDPDAPKHRLRKKSIPGAENDDAVTILPIYESDEIENADGDEQDAKPKIGETIDLKPPVITATAAQPAKKTVIAEPIKETPKEEKLIPIPETAKEDKIAPIPKTAKEEIKAEDAATQPVNEKAAEAKPESAKDLGAEILLAIGSMANETRPPERIIGDYSFLLGRVLTKTLETYGGEIIAPSGAAVTAEIVGRAQKNGKLVELTLNSKII